MCSDDAINLSETCLAALLLASSSGRMDIYKDIPSSSRPKLLVPSTILCSSLGLLNECRHLRHGAKQASPGPCAFRAKSFRLLSLSDTLLIVAIIGMFI